MFTDAATTTLLGVDLYLYGVFVSLGVLSAGILLLILSKHDEASKNAAALTLLLSPALGLLVARLLYCLTDATFAEVLSLRAVFQLSSGGFAMYGALSGAVAGAWIAAKVSGKAPKAWLDMVAPALMLFVFFARLGEGYTALGTSRPLIGNGWTNSFLIIQDEYDSYFKVYLLEAAAALVLCAVLLYLSRKKKAGEPFLTGCLLYGLSQTVFESLRSDRQMAFSFVCLQHVLSAVLFSAVVVLAAIRLLKAGKSRRFAVTSMASLPLLVAVIIGLEFVIDRSSLSKWISYAIYVILLMWPGYAGLRMIREGNRHDKRTA